MAQRIGHFEVGAAEFDGQIDFYRELFGWRVQGVADGYAMVDTQAGSGLNGGIGRSSDGTPWVSFYVGARDLKATLQRAESLGGATALDVTVIPDLVTFAMFRDPDGNLVGLVESPEADEDEQRGPSPGDGAPVDWFEVLGADAERTQRFYSELFGWTMAATGTPGYHLVPAEEAGIGGGLGGGARDVWATVYAKVPDVEATLAKAESLGASRVYGPNQVDDHTRTGAFRDPAGNVFGVYEHPDH
jgi:predicted enzyme related to lactoylglutathione lyase